MHIYNKTNKEIVDMAPNENPNKKAPLIGAGLRLQIPTYFYSTERSEIPFLSRVRISLAVSFTR